MYSPPAKRGMKKKFLVDKANRSVYIPNESNSANAYPGNLIERRLRDWPDDARQPA
ncbi:hypothetical protein BSNK01_05570 [Bacillaceae bacterium]